MREAFLSAEAMPFLRSQIRASSAFPSHSPSAFLQSIMPAPDLSLTSLTCLAVMAMVGFAVSSFCSSSLGSSLGSAFLASDSALSALVCASTSAAKSSSRFSMPSPRVYLTKRLIEIFSPSSAVTSLITSSTVLALSLMKSCLSRAFSFTILSSRPCTIFSLMFSGLESMSSIFICTSLSAATIAGSTSSGEMYSISGHAATCMAMSAMSALNRSPRATKSVSQFTSTRTPRRAPAWMYEPTAPSAAMREAFLSAEAMPFFLSQTRASSSSPPHSPSAFLQSIMPAPDFSRTDLTCAAVMPVVDAAGTAVSSFFCVCLGASFVASTGAGAACVHFGVESRSDLQHAGRVARHEIDTRNRHLYE